MGLAGYSNRDNSSQKGVLRTFQVHKYRMPANTHRRRAMKESALLCLCFISLVLIAYGCHSMSLRIEELETWIKRHKAIFKDEETRRDL